MYTLGTRLDQEVRPMMTIVGASAAALSMRRFAKQAAHCDFSILLLGETGTGKDHLAEHIHELGGKNRPFVPLDCGTVPDALIESELFGHTKGAFTGAMGEKDGLIKTAEGGTLFLNEVANLSFDLQAKLLRFVEGRSFRKLGDTREIQVSTRIIAATNTNLDKAVAEKKFRSDLYYRLNVVTHAIPPLRERKEDITLLAEHFLSQKAPDSSWSGKAQEALRAHEWPGNVRELRATIDRAIFNAGGQSTIVSEHVELLRMSRETHQDADGDDHYLTMREHEEKYWKDLLTWTGGNVSAAARIAGVGRPHVYNKVRRYNLGHLVTKTRES